MVIITFEKEILNDIKDNKVGNRFTQPFVMAHINSLPTVRCKEKSPKCSTWLANAISKWPHDARSGLRACCTNHEFLKNETIFLNQLQ